jgi:hypothetical protein
MKWTCAKCGAEIKHKHVYDFRGTSLKKFNVIEEFDVKDCGITDDGVICRDCFSQL